MSTKPLSGLTIVMPAYDESENVEPAIDAALRAGERFAAAVEVVIVDDGSRDDTAARVRRRGAADPRVRLVQHERNRGYGGALRSGLAAATQPYVFYTDCDLQFDLGQIAELLPHLERVPVVVGYRRNRQDNILRRFNGVAWSALQGLVFGLGVRDVDCAFKIFRRDVLDEMTVESEGAFVSAEILYRARAAGHGIQEIPVDHYPRPAGQSSGGRPDVILRAFGELWHFRQKLRQERRP